jgi:hypothetical protein
MTTLGEQFARALAAKDFTRVTELLHPEVDFRGMTPGRFWEATGPAQVVDEILTSWFEDQDVVEQQAYYSTTDGRISWMRVLCSGFRPAPPG